MNDKVLLGKLAISVVSLALALLFCRHPVFNFSNRRFSITAWLFMAASRIALFLVIFEVLHEPPQSDVLLYHQQARGIIAGQLPYRDFFSGYAPLFPYEAAVAVKIWDSPKSLILVSILFELLAFPVWLRACRRAVSEELCRFAAILYVTSAIPLINVAIDGQNQIWASLLLALALLFTVAGQNFRSGLMVGASVALVKFLPLIFFPAWFAASNRRLRWTLGALLVPLIVYGIAAYHGLDVLVPVRENALNRTSGNVPFLLRVVCPGVPPRLFDVGTLLLLAVVLVTVVGRTIRRLPPAALIHLVSAILLVLLLMSKKAYISYAVMIFFPLCVSVAASGLRSKRWTIVAFSVFGMVAVLDPSLWFRWLNEQDLKVAWLAAPQTEKMLIFLACDLLLVGFYGWYATQAWRLARTAARRDP